MLWIIDVEVVIHHVYLFRRIYSYFIRLRVEFHSAWGRKVSLVPSKLSPKNWECVEVDDSLIEVQIVIQI